MDQFEKNMLHLEELQRKYISTPDWAKAEQLERTIPQSSIWGMRRKKSKAKEKIYRKIKDLFQGVTK